MVIKVNPEDEAAGMAVVTDLLKRTTCLDDVRGEDMSKLAFAIAIGIVRDRMRVAAEAAKPVNRPPPTLVPGPGAPTS